MVVKDLEGKIHIIPEERSTDHGVNPMPFYIPGGASFGSARLLSIMVKGARSKEPISQRTAKFLVDRIRHLRGFRLPCLSSRSMYKSTMLYLGVQFKVGILLDRHSLCIWQQLCSQSQ